MFDFLFNRWALLTIAIVGIYTWHVTQEEKDTIFWQETRGTIVAGHIKEVHNYRSFYSWLYDRKYFEVVLDYRYQVDEHTYTGHRIKVIAPDYLREKDAMAALANYPDGAKITVYYNPQKPQQAVLIRNYSTEPAKTAVNL